jgi:opacity protein-like surface antigen
MARILLAALLVAAPVAAQTAAPAAAPVIVAQPKFTALQGQSSDRQQLDSAQCQNQATQATGFVFGSAPPASVAQQGPQGNRIRGAALGAATGAVVGSAGSGAAAGTVAGGSASRAARRQEQRVDDQNRANWEQSQRNWGQQFASCMTQRGYSVP